MKKIIKQFSILLLSSMIASCSKECNSNDKPLSFDEEAILNADVEIDLVVQTYSQNGTFKDIGNFSLNWNKYEEKYYVYDVPNIELFPYFYAAHKFKEIAPNVKINLTYSDDESFHNIIKEFKKQNENKNHVYPELMVSHEGVYDMLEKGYNYDLNHYRNTKYYQAYNEYFLSRFNYGGFQAAFPLSVDVSGLFVNLDTLEKYNIVSKTTDDNGITDEYKNWVNYFTWDEFVKTITRTNDETHAGINDIFQSIMSFSVPSIYYQFSKDGTVDLTSSSSLKVIEQLLNFENEISQNCIYPHDENSLSFSFFTSPKPQFENAIESIIINSSDYRSVPADNFIKDQYSTFYKGRSSSSLPSYIENKLDTTIKFDYLPYPKVDETGVNYSEINLKGIVIGNQCPIESTCTATQQLNMDVAAYFAMFMNLDPRAIEGRLKTKFSYDMYNIKWDNVGSFTLPLIKQGIKFPFQENEKLDPAKDFDDNWQYQLSSWFDNYKAYVVCDEKADVKNFTNILPGFTKLLDSMYGINGKSVTCIDIQSEPIYYFENSIAKNIFNDWENRFYDHNIIVPSGKLGTKDYVDKTKFELSDNENNINTNAIKALKTLQKRINGYYGRGKYDVFDRSYRNNYKGALK